MSLSAYLAKNYLTASTADGPDPSSRPKKRRKRDKAESGLVIADDDDLSLSRSKNVDQDDEGTPVFDGAARTAEFRRAKKNNWTSIGASAPSDADQAVADRILADAAKDNDDRRRLADGEDGPAIVDEGSIEPYRPRPGLQTAEDSARMAAAAAKRRATEAKESKSVRKKEAEETVYRDATGRRIDVSMKRAEARAAEEEKRRAEKQKRDEAMGDVQRKAREDQRKAVDEAKFLTVARHVDDQEMNDDLKQVDRWGDPMLAYMRDQGKGEKVTTGAAAGPANGAQPTSRKKQYQGAAPPNRYGIRPGWRWDGVDRGNGFEREWFQAREKKSRNESLAYQWQMDE